MTTIRRMKHRAKKWEHLHLLCHESLSVGHLFLGMSSRNCPRQIVKDRGGVKSPSQFDDEEIMDSTIASFNAWRVRMFQKAMAVSQLRELQKSAWSLFRLLGTLCVGGAQGRREEESAKQRKASDVAGVVAPFKPISLTRVESLFGTPTVVTQRFTTQLQRDAFSTVADEMARDVEIMEQNFRKACHWGSLSSKASGDHKVTEEKRSGCANDSSVLEVVEVESFLHQCMLFVYSLSSTPIGQSNLPQLNQTEQLLCCLFRVMKVGSPRLQRLAMQILFELTLSYQQA